MGQRTRSVHSRNVVLGHGQVFQVHVYLLTACSRCPKGTARTSRIPPIAYAKQLLHSGVIAGIVHHGHDREKSCLILLLYEKYYMS